MSVPGIFVQRIFQGTEFVNPIEFRTTRPNPQTSLSYPQRTPLEPFKNQFSPPAIRMMAEHLAGSFSEFPVEAFVTRAATGLDALELKDRVRHIGRALADLLPTAWGDAAPIIVGALGDEVDPEHAGSGVMDGSSRGL